MLKSSCSQSDPLRILLTGATGSLGSNVVAEAARCGLEVRAVLLGTPNDFAAYNGIESRWRSTLPIADLYRQTGRDAEGESVLRAATATSARDAGPRPLDNKASASAHGHP